MSEKARRKWEHRSAAFKVSALERMRNRECVKALAKELGVPRSLLYWWKQQAEARGRLKAPGAGGDTRDQAVRELQAKVAELEGAVGRKTLEADFFASALRRIEASRQKRGNSGATASTPKSAAGRNRKDN
jgi:transposase-like protein